MVKGNKTYLPILLLCIFLTMLFSGNSYALVKGNDSEIAFLIGTDGGSRALITEFSTGSTLRDYLIEGASMFLDSYSNALAFLKEIEISDADNADFETLSRLLDNAIVLMENSNIAYTGLVELADVTEYNPDVILELIRFPYTPYMKANHLNREVFRDLTNYLHEGDVRGAYARMLKDTEDILEILYRVKITINSNQLPDGPPLWTFNQYYSESLLFGQYMAGVFSEISALLE